MRAQHEHVARAIVFLVASRSFVFSNRAVVVFVDGAGCDDADLFVVTHDQAVQIEARLSLFFQRAIGNQFFVILDGFAIHGVAMDVSTRRQVDFRTRHVQKTERISIGSARASSVLTTS